MTNPVLHMYFTNRHTEKFTLQQVLGWLPRIIRPMRKSKKRDIAMSIWEQASLVPGWKPSQRQRIFLENLFAKWWNEQVLEPEPLFDM